MEFHLNLEIRWCFWSTTKHLMEGQEIYWSILSPRNMGWAFEQKHRHKRPSVHCQHLRIHQLQCSTCLPRQKKMSQTNVAIHAEKRVPQNLFVNGRLRSYLFLGQPKRKIKDGEWSPQPANYPNVCVTMVKNYQITCWLTYLPFKKISD